MINTLNIKKATGKSKKKTETSISLKKKQKQKNKLEYDWGVWKFNFQAEFHTK